MKKQLFKNGIVSLVLCFVLLFSGTTIYADVPTETQTEDVSFQNEEMNSTETEAAIQESVQDVDSTESVEPSTELLEVIPENATNTEENAAVEVPEESTEVTEPTEDSITEEVASTDGISIIGMEGISIKEIADIESSDTRSSCNGLHTWETVSVIQEGNCELEWIYKIRCTACGATATAYTDAPGHNYVDGVCTVCGGIEVASDEELAKWEYTLNDTDGTITLTKYISDVPDVVVYGKYKVNGKLYSAVLNGGEFYNEQPFSERRGIITSVKINDWVSSENCHGLFQSCSKIILIDFNGDIFNTKDMGQMFYSCRNIKTIDLSDIDTSSVVDMSDMFWGCENLTSLDVSKFNTSNVTNMSDMFWGCENLTSLDVSKFNTSNVTNMSDMFAYCRNLTSLDVSKFNTSNVTNMSEMFCAIECITEIDVSNFDTSKVTDMSKMFSTCYSITEIDVSKFNTSNVTNMEDMFCACTVLKTLNVKKFDTSKVQNMETMFSGCQELTMLNLTSFKTSNATNMNNMFRDSPNLANIYVDEDNWDTTNATTTDMFTNCGTQTVTKI